MSVVILQDEIVHYEVLGRGRPLIFLHGWVGSWRYWIPTMQAASFSYRAYAIDLWGFGDSAKNPGKYTLELQSELLNEFMDKLGIAKIALIGHGLGAVVALQFASRYPQLVDRAMAVSCPVSQGAVNQRLRVTTPADLAEWLLARTPNSEAARGEAPKADVQAILTSLDDLENIDITESVRQVITPFLFVQGQNDLAVAVHQEEELTFLPVHTHYVSFEQSGHFPMLEEDTKFNRLLADFLALPSGESPRQLQLKEEWKRRVR